MARIELEKVFPSKAPDDVGDGPIRHSVDQRELSVRLTGGRAAANSTDIVIAEMSAGMVLPKVPMVGAGSHRITGVLALSAEVEMVGPDADCDIALVQDMQSLRYRSKRQNPTETVCSDHRGTLSNVPVPTRVLLNTARPEPAPFGLLDFPPEPVFYGFFTHREV